MRPGLQINDNNFQQDYIVIKVRGKCCKDESLGIDLASFNIGFVLFRNFFDSSPSLRSIS